MKYIINAYFHGFKVSNLFVGGSEQFLDFFFGIFQKISGVKIDFQMNFSIYKIIFILSKFLIYLMGIYVIAATNKRESV